MDNIGARIQNIVNVYSADDMTREEARGLIDRILDGYGLVPARPAIPPGMEVAVRELLALNSKIRAIKVVREATGWGLRESKDWVDRLALAC